MIRVLVAEDQALLRGALCEILGRDSQIDVVAACATGSEVIQTARHTHPDVAVLDIEMPGIDGLEAARQLSIECPEVKVLMLTVFGRPGYLRRAISNGALGFILKDAPPATLIDAIKRTAAGERIVDPDLAVSALEHGQSPLTARETEVLALSRTVTSSAALASQLHLSEGTVRNLLSSVNQKLHATSRAQAAQIAESHGWL
ncbi:MAG: response regulator transcription factor [Candidatus Nanopelagicales bacterium]